MEVYLNEMVRYLVAQSWQIAVLTAAVAAATFTLRHRSAHVRYLLWLIVVAKCLVPPLHAVPLPVLPPTPSARGVSSVLSQPPQISPPSTFTNPAVREISSPHPHESAPPLQASQVQRHRLSACEWLGLVWIAGAGAYLMMNLLRASRGHYWLRKTRRPLPDDVQTNTANLLRAYGARRLPRIWIMEGAGQPFVWGLLRGNIYVPPGFLTIEDPEHRRDILAHELSHVLRLDATINALQVIAQGLFWFHPFVWWSSHKVRQEREKCCDEMVLARLHATPRDYSTAILETLAHATESIRPIPSLAIAGPLKSIEERIRTMLRPGRRFHTRPGLAVAAMAVLVALVAVPTTFVLTARAEMPPATQREDRPSQSVNETAVERGESRQPRFAARTFNSKMAFDIFVQETSDFIFDRGYLGSHPRTIGRTPSATPVEVPACSIWGAEPLGPAKDWDLLVREIGQNKVPALRLSRATDSDMEHLAGVTGLEHLDLSYTQITDIGLTHLKGLTRLQELGLLGTRITDTGLAHLKGLTGLRGLELSGTGITEAGLAELKGLTGLHLLNLSWTPLTDAGLTYLEDMAALQFLDLTGFRIQITDAGLAHLKGLTGLQHLRLQNNPITDAGLEHLRGLTELRRLEFSGAAITDAGLAHLKGLAKLQVLLVVKTKVTGPGLQYLKGMGELLSLLLMESPITDAGLEHLQDLTGLRQLCLSNTEITDAGLTHLAGLIGLEDLELSHTAITDAGLEHLKDLTGLRSLDLRDTQITDAGLEHLQGLSGLWYLRTSGTQITAAGIRQLGQSLPNPIRTD